MDTKRKYLEVESLSDYVRRVRRERNLTTVEVEKQSGGRITDGYVSQIENGYIKNVSIEKLAALAKGLGVTEPEIFAVARGMSPLHFQVQERIREAEASALVNDYVGLLPEDQKELQPYMDFLRSEIKKRTAKQTDESAERPDGVHVMARHSGKSGEARPVIKEGKNEALAKEAAKGKKRTG